MAFHTDMARPPGQDEKMATVTTEEPYHSKNTEHTRDWQVFWQTAHAQKDKGRILSQCPRFTVHKNTAAPEGMA